MTIEETRAEYKAVLGRNVPPNMLKNQEWLEGKIAEKRADGIDFNSLANSYNEG